MTSPIVLMKAWNLRPRKELGQNFIKDRSVADMIVSRAGVTATDIVLEIGAGLGALTVPLARHARKVYAVEKDRQIAELLRTELLASGCDNVVLLPEDVLKMDLEALAASENSRLLLMGNIPYNISSQILVKLIERRKVVEKAVLMFQKELALRITAEPGGKAYGRLAVMLGYCASVRSLADISAAVFFPRPQIDSVVLEILFKDRIHPAAKDESFLFKVIKAGFSKRRKTLKNSLAGPLLHLDPKTAARELAAAGIDPVRRSETLSVSEFVMLSNHLHDAGYR